jgi:hypothetical protein
MADEFFKDETAVADAPETVKVGDKEYTQEQLAKVVGLGEIADEAQTKYNRPIEKFWPEFTKAQQKSQELEKEVQELKSFKERLTAPDIKVPTQEEQYAQAREQARQIGLTDEDTTRRIYREERATEKLVDTIEKINEDAGKLGKPVVSKEELVKYMVDEGFRNPEKAYKDMFETELKDWEAKQIEKIKSPGYSTQETSTAGAKQPVFETPKTPEELQNALHAFFNSEEGAENA